MTDFYKGLAGGFSLGLNLGTQLRKRRMEDELSQLHDAGITEGTGLKVTTPNGETSTIVINPQTPDGLETIKRNYEQAGYKVEQMTPPQYMVYSGNTNLGTYSNLSAAEDAARKYNYDLGLRRAGIYEKYGEEEAARKIREDAERNFYYGLVNKKTQMELDNLARKAEQEKNYDNFMKFALSEEGNKLINSPDGFRQALMVGTQQYNLTPDYLTKAASTILQIPEQEIKAYQLDLAKKLQNVQTLDDLSNVYDQIKDGRSLQYAIDPKTKKVSAWLVDSNTGNPITDKLEFKNQLEAVVFGKRLLSDPVQALGMLHDERQRALQEQKLLADIGLSNARAAAERAGIGLTNARIAKEKADTELASARIATEKIKQDRLAQSTQDSKLPPAVKETVGALKQELAILGNAYMNETDPATKTKISREMANRREQLYNVLSQYGGGLYENTLDKSELLNMYNQASPEQKARFRMLYPGIFD